MFIKPHRAWELPESAATPEEAFINRRSIIKAAGLGLASAAGGMSMSSLPAFATEATADLYPATRNLAYRVSRDLTPEATATTYNNFYEFGGHKQISRLAQALPTDPWDIQFDGAIEKPFTIGFEDLVRKMSLEERLYRFRCVEAWAMTVPWTGFPMAELVKFAKPLSSAKYVRMETFLNPEIASGQKQTWYPWAYSEGVSMAEATNDLAFMVTGVYGKPLPKQMGAPIRLALPWKYGFKSIKSIVKVTFSEERPVSFWEKLGPKEYGFWANVNPEVDHRRWSQKTERLIHTGERVPTRIFNGYGEQVAHLYTGLEGQNIYY
ncbi:MAG: protein-methionine-sulfoxide reductase catalytic subunit MsrP [Pseudomonadota bacterium]